MTTRRLLLLRHATAEDFRPGFEDKDRRLTERGRAEAVAVGDWLRQQKIVVDHVVCSSAVRTRQTLAGLELSAPVDFSDAIYSGEAETIITAAGELDDGIGTGLIIGHSPAIPTAARDLADPDASDPESLTTLDRRYPPATLALLESPNPWSDLGVARLLTLRLP
ncbi:SixA phosphatase family protein [Microlunatus speluncae]|uniref:SixA phosphatase family protein n=1 Tax=Microlunatus speluncae TaxID=2594267 RepID=UPI0012668042|nr:histidine phosphatase family protein [Microlunatus speluncae]